MTTPKEWNVRIQLGGWVATVPIRAATAKEAHRLALDALLAVQMRQEESITAMMDRETNA